MHAAARMPQHCANRTDSADLMSYQNDGKYSTAEFRKAGRS
jgi:hypothetical protein